MPPFAELAERAGACAAGFETRDRPGEEAAADETGADALSILVVDDDAVQRRLLPGTWRKPATQVCTACDGAEALPVVLETNPQVVITDLLMPQMGGTALVKALRQTKLGRALYVILLTSSDDDENQVAAFEAGADDYLVKPIRPRILAAACAPAFASSGCRRK